MIYNQVLEQFGDWIVFWNDFKSWFLVREVDLDFVVDDLFSRYPFFWDHYERKKATVEGLLEDIGYEGIELGTPLRDDRSLLVAALVEANIPQMDLASYEGGNSEFLGLIDHFYQGRENIKRVAKPGQAFVYVISPVEENIDRDVKEFKRWMNHRIDRAMYDLVHGSEYTHKLKPVLKNMFNHYADLFGTRERERNFDLFNRLPIPRDAKELEKIGKLVMGPKTNAAMDELGIVRTEDERVVFFVQENRRELKNVSPRVAWMYPKEYIQQRKYCNERCYDYVEAFIMTDSHRSRIEPLLQKEDPQLNFSFESLVECELLKKEFFRSMKFHPEMSLDEFQLGSFVFSTLREDLVEEFSKRMDDYLVALHRHALGNWLIFQEERGNDDAIQGIILYKATPFTYNLLGVISGIFFLFFSRKVLKGGWWKGNVQVVSFIFQLLKEQSNIRAIVHLPLLFTVFIFILFHNLMGLLPFGYTITSHILVTFFFGFSLWLGITILIWKEKGKEMIQLFLPKGVPSFLVPFLFLIEVISYLFRTVSLSVRLFANMMAGHALLHILSNFGVVISSLSSPLRFFFIFPLMVVCLITFLEVGIALLQAYVFTVLLAIYLNDVYSLESH